ncbi:ABC transporter substrate-binding protein [Paenibacillus sp. 481]|uniref:ABC transporter substrate-binding protein n=1 Tax=Paenibacillus sp. 481 TaxID=2835869 RepID=UPI001E38DF21|nr:extracellular solute-binding protein [Paenibacillus sp. 481]UHA73571.1 extracellular solute-binding protein [Paenibacillus sp. 481]
MKSKRIVKKVLLLSLAMSLMIPLFTACTSSESSKGEGNQVLRIGILNGISDDSHFRNQYTDIFEITNKGVRIEIVPAVNQDARRYEDHNNPTAKAEDGLANLKKLLTGSNPVDVVVADVHSYQALVRDGLLKDISPLVQKENIDLTKYVPAVIDGIKALGDGKLYGLTPSFDASAIYYNKKLFKEAGVDFPRDGMDWDELFTLAQRVSKGEGKARTYGFSFSQHSSDLNTAVDMYTKPLNLLKFDEKGEKMLVNSPQWKRALEKLVKLYRDKTVMSEQPQWSEKSGPLDYDLFLSGRTAMVVGSYFFAQSVNDAMQNAGKIKGFTPFEWDVVTLPEHREMPGVNSSIQLSDIISINAKANNPELAWKFLEFSNSEDIIKLKSRNSYNLVSIKSLINKSEKANYNIEAFYKMKPLPPNKNDIQMSKLFEQKPNIHYILELEHQMMYKMLASKKSVDEFLKDWESKGNSLLQQIKKTPRGNLSESVLQIIHN